jgi:hypothetical protein
VHSEYSGHRALGNLKKVHNIVHRINVSSCFLPIRREHDGREKRANAAPPGSAFVVAGDQSANDRSAPGTKQAMGSQMVPTLLGPWARLGAQPVALPETVFSLRPANPGGDHPPAQALGEKLGRTDRPERDSDHLAAGTPAQARAFDCDHSAHPARSWPDRSGGSDAGGLFPTTDGTCRLRALRNGLDLALSAWGDQSLCSKP